MSKHIILNPAWITAKFGLAIYTHKGLSRELDGPRWATMSDMDHDWARISQGLGVERDIPKYITVERN